MTSAEAVFWTLTKNGRRAEAVMVPAGDLGAELQYRLDGEWYYTHMYRDGEDARRRAGKRQRLTAIQRGDEMTAEEWLLIVQAAITKSGLPYRVFSCGRSQDSATCFATVEHQRTKALREISLSRDIFLPQEMPNEIVHQLRAFNLDFAAPCAKGHLPVLQFERDELRRLLTDGTLTFYCVTCDEFRVPTAKELRAIRRLLTEPVA